MSPRFLPPVALSQPRVLPSTKGPARALWRHYSARPVGRSVLKENGVYVTVDTPTIDRTLAAEEYYAGGHEYVVSDAVAAALTSAGYTVTEDPDVFPLTSLYPSASLFPKAA